VIVALVVGTVLAVGALAFVLYPVFFTSPQPVRSVALTPRQTDREAAVAALREIEFDKATVEQTNAKFAYLVCGELRVKQGRQGIRELVTFAKIIKGRDIDIRRKVKKRVFVILEKFVCRASRPRSYVEL